VGALAHLQAADVGGVLHHFEAAEHVALGISQRLALLGGQRCGEGFDVVADELLQLQEDARALADGRLTPGLESGLGRRDGRCDLIGRGHGHARQAFLGGRVDHLAPFGALGLHEFAVD